MNIRKFTGFAIGPIGGAFLGFITLPLTAWFFKAEDIGRVALFQVIIGFTTMLFSLGLDQAYVREYHEKENKSDLWKQTCFPGLYLLIFICFILIFQPYLLSDILFHTESWLISVLVVIAILANYLIRFFSLILRMQEKGFLFSMSQIWPKFFNIAFLLSFVVFYNHNEFIYLLCAQVFSSMVACLIFAWNTREEWSKIDDLKLDFIQLKSLLKFGMPLIIGGLAFWSLNSIDRLFIKTFSNFTELGIYSLATSFATIAIIVQSIFSTVWAPLVYKWLKNNENLDRIHNITWYLTIVIAFVFSAVGLFSGLISFILPKQYHAVQYIVLCALVAPLLYTLSETTVVGIGISRKSHLSLYASLGAFIASIVLNYIFVPKLGALGASISSALSFLIFFVLRTELSAMAWRDFPRAKVYIIILIIVTLALFNAIFQERFNLVFKLIWLIFLLISSINIWKIFMKIKANYNINGDVG